MSQAPLAVTDRSSTHKVNNKSIGVLYEDDCYMVFDKPPGLLVIPSPKQEKNTLVSLVNQLYATKDEASLHPCHRLDRDTSGVILFAKGKKYQQLMMHEFMRQKVKKKYIAFVDGHLKHKAGTVRSPIIDFDARQHAARRPHSKMAVTHFQVTQSRATYSVVEIIPETGRTNQIRIHMSQMGHPLLGDRKYGEGKNFSVKFKRAALHASEIEWPHPVYHRTMKTKSPLAEDMKDFLGRN